MLEPGSGANTLVLAAAALDGEQLSVAQRRNPCLRSANKVHESFQLDQVQSIFGRPDLRWVQSLVLPADSLLMTRTSLQLLHKGCWVFWQAAADGSCHSASFGCR